MAKQLNVSLAFTADTSQAKMQLQDLQNQLNKITTGTKIGTGIEADIRGAITAATELSVHLKKATNLETGNLDFAKFNQSIKQSGMSLQQYGAQLQKLGPQGQQAFMSLAQSVTLSEIPIRRSNTLVRELGTTLANTARWQLSSSMLHGFMSAVQSAYGYAQDLNESLNNIRIVTGQNIDQMAKFAQEANKAAKALSATTTDYTNASLIYYQQGLNDQQVKERTDITIKMANVARESAEVVSDQMTAVWNNFYDGSKSLEHYADVMTALGAATASSTDEIAGGLEKFAAIGNTIGLSFEYAASALATITSNTRQSEEVVGTALKTIFARIQGLKLGESLEDGTDLNKYSEALQKVGISIYDSSGELKKMDNILDEMAAKWGGLSKAQQAALAQTVAGVRQYTQLIALMENWDNGDSDSMVANLNTSAASAGALQEQADIYAESWEAARDRVTAALESIYSQLVDDEAFISILNNIEKVIDFISSLVDNLGGLKGVLLAVGTIVTKVFSSQLSQGLTSMAYNIKMMTSKGRESEVNAQRSFINNAVDSIPQNKDFITDTESAQQESMRSQLTLQQEYLNNADHMSAIEAEVNQKLMDRSRLLHEQVVASEQSKEAIEQSVSNTKMDILTDVSAYNLKNPDAQLNTKEVNRYMLTLSKTSKMQDVLASSGQRAFTAISTKSANADKAMEKFALELSKIKFTKIELGGKAAFDGLKSKIDAVVQAQGPQQLEKAMQALNQELEILSKKTGLSLKDLVSPDAKGKVDQLTDSLRKKAEAQRQSSEAAREAAIADEDASKSIQNSQGAQKQWSDIVVAGANVAMSAAMAFQMLGSTIDTLESPDASGWEKFTSVLMTFGMLIPTLISAWTSLKTVISTETVVKLANVAATLAQVAAESALNKTKGQSSKFTKENIKKTIEDTKNKWNQGALDKFSSKKGSGFTKNKNGTYSVKGVKGFQKAGDAAKMAGKAAGKAVAGAAIIAVAVTAAVKIVEAAVKYYNRFDEAAEKAKETAKSMQATYETVKSAEEDFRNTIGQYQSGVDGLEKLTKGTEEYEDAVRSANNEAVKLLNTYDNLKYEINDDGLIVIDESDLASAKRESLLKEAIAFSAKTNAQQDADTAQLEANKVRFQREQMKTGGVHWDSDDTTAVAGGLGAGAALAGGAVAYTAIAASNVWNPVGWAMLIAGAVTAAIGAGIALFNNDADSREAETLTALEEFSTQNGGRDLTEEEIKKIADNADASGKLADSLLEDVNATNSMISEMRANTEAITRNNELIANQILQSNDYVAGSEHYDEIVETSGLVEDIEYKEALARIQESTWGKDGISQLSGANAEAKNVWDSYLKYAGKEDSGWELVDTKGSDTNRIFVYLDENGQRQEKTLAEMQKARASWEAAIEVNANANQLVGLFAEWANKEGAADQAIASFLLNKNFEDATQNETNSVKNDVTQNYDGDYEAYLQAKLGDLDVAATQLGYESADKLVEAFINALNDSDSSWSDINFGNLSSDVQKNTKASDAKKISDIAIKMNAGLVKDGGDIFTAGINDLVSGLSGKEQEEALSRIANLDWSQWDAAYQAADVIRGLGYEVDTSSASFQQWADIMNRASGAAYDHAQALGDISKMQELIEDLELGDVVSQEDYDMLVKYNDEIARYFRLLGDGTYKFVGDPLDAKQAIGEGIDEAYGKAVVGAQTKYEQGQFRKEIDDTIEDKKFTRDTFKESAWGVTGSTEVAPEATWKDKVGAVFDTLDAGLSSSASSVSSSHSTDYNENLAARVAEKEPEKKKTYGIVSPDLYNAQIDFIDKYMEDYTDAQIKEWRDHQTENNAEEIAGIVGDFLDDYDPISENELTGLSTELQELKDKQLSAEIDYARSADSSEELTQMYDEGQISDQAYATAQLENATEEKWEGMDVQEVEDYADALMEAADNSELLDDNLSQEAAEDVALYVKKMNQGIKKLSDGFEDWKSILDDSSDAASEEFCDAMKNTKDAMSDVLGVSEDFISDDFIIEHLEGIEKAAKGDADAIDALAAALGEDIILQITADDTAAYQAAINAHESLQTLLDGKQVGFSINADMDTEGIITGAQSVVDSAKMTVEEAQAYFNSLGYEPTFATETKEIDQTVPITVTETTVTGYTTGTATMPDGTTKDWEQPILKQHTYQDGVAKTKGEMEVVALSADGTPKIESLTKKSSGAMNNSSSSNPGGKSGGGGGSKPKKTSESKKKKSDIVDRYKEINDQLEKTTRQMNKNNIAADGLWGSKRIAMLKKNIDLMKQECKQLEEKHKLSIKYLSEDRSALEDAASDAGISFSFDANGTITNYTSEMTALFNKREALLKSFGDTMDEDEEERLKELDDKIEAVKSAYEQYETTLDERDDFEEERLQKVLDTQTAYYDMLNEELEIKISIDEDALETIEYYLSKIEDDFYQMFEAAALMIGDASSLEQGQIKHYLSEVDSQQKYVEDLDKAHTTIDPKTKETEINDAQYMEGLRQAKTDTIASLQALQDLDKTMMHYYGDTLAAASEELSKYTTLMEHQTSVLDHYKNIMDILGYGKDYKKMGVILDAQAKTIGNEAKVAKENYNMLKEQAEARKAEYDQAVAQGLAQSEIDAYKQRWMDAENAANEAQENMLSKTEAWAEAMKAVVENKLNDLDQTLENALTADFGGSFDLMNSAFERANSLQEEFLTTTNKIYETNKLMRQAQQEIDKTSNEVAKKRLKQFINETNQLQNKNKLSDYELKIQQAKYDLALAQIALEEAQNAKSTVRLQRDAEGNFGYVYTADQNAVAEAQQKFEDAQNSLYNIGLEGANSYAEKYQQTLSEFYSTMTELQHQYLNGEFENEAEYQEAMLAAREYYYEKLQQYSSLYTVAIDTDTRVVADAWSTQYANMTQNTEEWMFNVDSYVEGVKVAFGEWEAQMAQIEEETIGPDLDALTERTQTLTSKSQELADTILGENGVLNAIEQEVTQVAELTGAYAGLREEIQEAIRQREELIRQIDERIQNENEGEDGDGSGGGGDGDGGDGSGGGNGNLDPKDASTKRGVALAIWNGSYGWGSGKTRKDRLKEKGFNPDEIQDLVNNTDPSAGWGSRYGITDLSKYAYSKFDTGGYTGAWGANGKFAMLHEKELVLNKGDTENFLASMELLDTIVKTIDLHSTNAALGGLLNSPYLNGMNNNEVLEQNVTIEANFPNVSSRTEIEEAFTTLVNRASQYANRK